MLARFVCRPACMKIEQWITSSVKGPARGRPGDVAGVLLLPPLTPPDLLFTFLARVFK